MRKIVIGKVELAVSLWWSPHPRDWQMGYHSTEGLFDTQIWHFGPVHILLCTTEPKLDQLHTNVQALSTSHQELRNA